MVAVGERSVGLADLPEIERLPVEVGHRVGILRSNGDMAQLGRLTSDCFELFGRLFDRSRQRLRPRPTMLGYIKEDVFRTVELLLEIACLLPAMALVDVVLGTEALELF